ncbi:Cnnm4, partial [Symbiodinium microadriaticum]
VLSELKQARVHLAFAQEVKDNGVLDNTYEVVGIVTLEDIIEEILGDIEDETDAQCGDEDGTIGSSAARDRELARLIMLTGKNCHEKLSLEEVQAISSHLMTNVPQLRPLFENSAVTVHSMQRMVTSCKVMELRRVATSDMVNSRTPTSDDTLFRRGKPANACCLVLSGRVAVLAGKDEFYSELGPWSVVGPDAVKMADGTYLPDFTSYILTESVRCLWITKSDVVELLEGKTAGVVGGRQPKRRSKPGKEESAFSPSPTGPANTDVCDSSGKSSEGSKRDDMNALDSSEPSSASKGHLKSMLQGFVPAPMKYKSLDEQNDDIVMTDGDIENGIQLKARAQKGGK